MRQLHSFLAATCVSLLFLAPPTAFAESDDPDDDAVSHNPASWTLQTRPDPITDKTAFATLSLERKRSVSLPWWPAKLLPLERTESVTLECFPGEPDVLRIYVRQTHCRMARGSLHPLNARLRFDTELPSEAKVIYYRSENYNFDRTCNALIPFKLSGSANDRAIDGEAEAARANAFQLHEIMHGFEIARQRIAFRVIFPDDRSLTMVLPIANGDTFPAKLDEFWRACKSNLPAALSAPTQAAPPAAEKPASNE